MAYVEFTRDNGLGWSQIVEEVGLSESALRRWREEEGVGDHVVPVELVYDVGAASVAEPSRSLGVVTLGG